MRVAVKDEQKVFHYEIVLDMKIFNRLLFCVLSFLVYPQSSFATISTCVVPDDQASVPEGCILFTALDGWLHSPSLHDESGNLRDDVLVKFQPGVYKLAKPFTVDRLVTGNGRHKLVMAGAGATQTVFSGARPLHFKPVPAELLKEKKLPSNLVVASLKEAGISEVPKFSDKRFGRTGMPELELFYQNTRMPTARWPNVGYAKTDKVETIAGNIVFTVKGRDIGIYKAEQDLQVGGYFMHDWADEKLQVREIDSAGRVSLTRAQPTYGVTAGRRVFFENALIDIDMPGEWYIDRRAGLIYFLPPKPIRADDVQVSQVANGLVLKGGINVEVRDLGFDAFRGVGILLDDVDTLTLRNLIIKNVGTDGIKASGINTLIEGVQVNNTGAAGISLNGGNRKTLQPGLLVVRKSAITQVGRLQKTYAPAVSLSGVGNIVEDSVLRGGPHAAIIFHGNDHQIRRNLIEDFVTETDDAGAIYTGRDWTERGTVIEENLIRNIGSSPVYRHGAHAIYLDDQASGIIVRNNLISKIGGRGVLIGGGRDNTISNNIFANCINGVYLDARGLVALAKHGAQANSDYIVILKKLDTSLPLYSSRYPGLAKLLEDEPGAPKNNIADGNIFMNCDPPYIKRLSQKGIAVTKSVIVSNTEKMLIDEAKVSTIPDLLRILPGKGTAPKPGEAMKVVD